MKSYVNRVMQRIVRDEEGITALETAIILIAFVVVASVFAFTILSAGTFSTERGKEAVFAGLSQVRSSIELKGSVIATATTTGTNGTIDNVIFNLANAVGGEPVNLNTTNRVVVIDYRDAGQMVSIDDWSLTWKVRSDADDLLESGELAEITVPLTGTLTNTLGINTDFSIEIKPPSGAVLNIQRTTPAYIETVYDLQ